MPILWLFVLVLALGLIGFVLGRMRALKDAHGDIRQLHSLPNYYGANVLFATLIPGFAVMVIWLIAQPMVVQSQVSSLIPERAYTDAGSLNLVMSDVRRVAEGLDVAVAEGAMSHEQARDIRTEFTDLRARLGAVGVALGSNVEPYVLQAAQKYRSL